MKLILNLDFLGYSHNIGLFLYIKIIENVLWIRYYFSLRGDELLMINKKGRIFNIQKYSIHDGHGIRTVVFFKGCPLNCIWCANPEGQKYEKEIRQNKEKCIGCNECIKICPVNAIDEQKNINRRKCIACGKCVEVCYSGALEIVGKEMSTEEVLIEVEKDIPFYNNSGGGITLSGGEPMEQAEFAISILKKCKENGIHTAIETCGQTSWDNFEKVKNYVDLILYDIKHIDSQEHKRLTGKPNEVILENFKMLSKIEDIKLIVRIPIIKPYNNDTTNIRGIAKFLKSLNRDFEVHLLPYHPYGISKYKQIGKIYRALKAERPSTRELISLEKIFKEYNFNVSIHGIENNKEN